MRSAHPRPRPPGLGSVLSLVVALLTALSACSGEEAKRTQLVLVADTDMQELDLAHFSVRAPDGRQQETQGALQPGEPAYVSMERGAGAALGPYAITVEGLAGGQVQVTRSAEVTFVIGRTLTVLLHLTRDCAERTCSGELVCALGQCRDRTIGEDELLPWSGEPPTLDVGGTDAGSGDASGLDAGDAGAEGGDAGGPEGGSGASCDPAAPRCMGASVELCVNGEIMGSMPCRTQDPCKRAVCTPGVGCATEPANDGSACGGMLTCRAGVCGGGQSCADGVNCRPECGAGALDCALDCGENGANCSPVCPAGASCDIDCSGTNNCTVTCRGDCAVSCGDADVCRVTCQTGSHCDIDCTGSAVCDRTRCDANAECTLRCGADNDCAFESCAASSVEECGGATFSCHADCP